MQAAAVIPAQPTRRCPNVAADVTYKIASTRQEREAAFRLVYETYLSTGLQQPNQHGLRVMPHHLLPTTDVFIARSRGDVIRTATLVADGKLGLPLESTYAKEVETRRRQGVRLGEFCCLADRRRTFELSFPVFVGLCRLLVQYARRQDIHEILIEVCPRHVRSYREFLAFEPFGRLRTCSLVCDRPAIGLCLNLTRLEQQRPENYELFFGKTLPDQQLEPCPISQPDCEYFGRMLARLSA